MIMEWFGCLLIGFMAGLGTMDILRQKKYLKQNEKCLKRTLFRYSVNRPEDNLVDVFLHQKAEMEMVNKGNDLCDDEPEFEYYDYFRTLRNEEGHDQND